MPKIEQCICGRKRIDEWIGKSGYFRKCPNCGLKSEAGKTKRESVENWNRAVEEYGKSVRTCEECGKKIHKGYLCEDSAEAVCVECFEKLYNFNEIGAVEDDITGAITPEGSISSFVYSEWE